MTGDDADVLVVGAGPAGLTLANLLTEAGVSVIVLERNEHIIDHARAVGIDDEAIRTLQTFRLAETVLANSLQNAPIRYHDSRGRVLTHVAPTARPYGWPRRNLFHQPFLEERLREALVNAAGPQALRTGHEVVGLEQDADGVRLTVRTVGERRSLRARFAVGADGGRSFVRDAVGVRLHGTTAPSKWLVVDVSKDSWDAPYSAVYTSADRPAMTIPLPFGLRRFEFRIKPAEDPEAFAAEGNVAAMLRRFYPTGELPTVVRSRVYWHHSRTASAFRSGSVFLAGDAAHLQPPFFGQGMNSGLRDVTNLYWKLAAAVEGRGGDALLDSYDRERRPTADAMVAFATQMGRYYKARNRFTESVRNALFRGLQRVPGGRDYILQMKYKPAPRYTEGLVVDGRNAARTSLLGRAFPQPQVSTADGRRRLDDVLGVRTAVLALAPDATAALTDRTLEGIRAQGGVVFQSAPPGIFERASVAVRQAQLDRGVLELTDTDGTLRDLLLAHPDDQLYVIRPDRYVGATARAADADRILGEYLALLDG
ncbi:bifunctional 3-(3-hydroxy-phenyl)propionate/3-hydroxycinnamic acid hydroxylase [Streptomyces sulphureus]|uniref:bifunctional 3-(3-hydroxy-phenyl)propionate/3-hydroxycinnamic acid hydroxylase n=1 Tax=Streptomyces sulphureus TaxID=47758 RepID=UPI0003768CF3|nr:bifunctional 3-(3-hydroxy-phenyl)propionate/3-hydroxycinnamic acid hydroxylase [Streptomyces sulphureus]